MKITDVDFIFIFPIIIFILYCIFTCFTKKLDSFDSNKIKRIYYLFWLIWSSAVILKYYDNIKSIKFTPYLGFTKDIWNFIIVGLGLLIIGVIWELLFLFPKSISELSLGNVKFSYQQKKEIDEYKESAEKTIDILKKVCGVEHKILCEMKDYANECISLKKNPSTMYIDLIEKYNIYQDEKIVFCELYNDQISTKLKKILKVSDKHYKEIIDNVDNYGYYIFKNNSKEFLITIINVCFNDNRLIIVLSDTFVFKEEYDILGHLVQVFDLELKNIINEDTIESLTDTINIMAENKM